MAATARIMLIAGNFAPVASARPVFTAPAVRPFHMAICDGSLPEILRVRLLSIPQQRQAAVMRSAPSESANPPSCGSESKMLPTRMNAKPTPTRLSTFSRNTIHAIAAVATASRLSKRDAALAEVVMSPSSSSAGPTTPPARMAPASQGRSGRERGVSVPWPERMVRTMARPMPEPR